MNLRLAILSTTLLFAFAPLANAQNLPNGASCRVDHPSDCQSQYCAVVPGSSAGSTGVCSNTPLTSGGGSNDSAGYGGGFPSTSGGDAPSQAAQTGQDTTASNSANFNFVETLVGVLAFIIRLGTFVAVVLAVYTAYLFVAAQGDVTKLAEARATLRWTIICALILAAAWVVMTGLQASVYTIASAA